MVLCVSGMTEILKNQYPFFIIYVYLVNVIEEININ